MALSRGQWQIRDLVMGPGTPYTVAADTKPLTLSTRASGGGDRAWNHGSWSGAEWAAERVVPIRVLVEAPEPASWLDAHQRLMAAFAPVADSGRQVEMRWDLAGQEFLILGRPRGAETVGIHGTGNQSLVQCGFVAQDPRIYSGTLDEVSTSLPTQTGGLTVPLTVPFVISGVLSGGRVEMANDGTTDTGLVLRIDGPVIQPRVAVQRPGGEVQTVRFQLDLGAGQWLDIDTASRTALLNGLPESNQRGRALWDIDPFPVAPGVNLLRFNAGGFNETAQVSARWRSAWW